MNLFAKIAVLGLGSALTLAGCASNKDVEVTRGQPRVSDPSPEQMRHAQSGQ